MNKKGFTLVEILAVIVILGLLVVFAIPNIYNAISGGKEKIDEINKKQIEDACKLIVTEVIYCNMSNESKNLLGNCETAKNKLINGVSIDLSNLNLDDKAKKCSGTVNIKIDRNTYKEYIDVTKVTCK